jgi:hypothetical protein
MSRWKQLNTWAKDVLGLSDAKLAEYLELARNFEASSMRKGMGRNPKAAREWRHRRRIVEEEMERRRASRG